MKAVVLHNPKRPGPCATPLSKLYIVNGVKEAFCIDTDGGCYVKMRSNQWCPLYLEMDAGELVRDVYANAAGTSFYCVTTASRLFSWGDNHMDELGHELDPGEKVEDRYFRHILTPMANCDPAWVELKNVKDVAVGFYHALVLSNEGYLYSWGTNLMGQLGLGDFTQRFTPRKVRHSFNGSKVVDISVSFSCSIALTEKNEIFFWGRTCTGTPVDIPKLMEASIKFQQVACSTNQCFAISEDHKLYLLCFLCNPQATETDAKVCVLKNPSFDVPSDGATFHEIRLPSEVRYMNRDPGFERMICFPLQGSVMFEVLRQEGNWNVCVVPCPNN